MDLGDPLKKRLGFSAWLKNFSFVCLISLHIYGFFIVDAQLFFLFNIPWCFVASSLREKEEDPKSTCVRTEIWSPSCFPHLSVKGKEKLSVHKIEACRVLLDRFMWLPCCQIRVFKECGRILTWRAENSFFSFFHVFALTLDQVHTREWPWCSFGQRAGEDRHRLERRMSPPPSAPLLNLRFPGLRHLCNVPRSAPENSRDPTCPVHSLRTRGRSNRFTNFHVFSSVILLQITF